MKRVKKNERGITLAETLVAMAIFSFIMLSTAVYISTAFTTSQDTEDRTFATEKALQIINELRAYAQRGEAGSKILDTFDDGTTLNPLLTTKSSYIDPVSGKVEEIEPGDKQSGNIDLGEGQWKFKRLVTVRRFSDAPDNKDIRYVTVRLYRYNHYTPENPYQVLAEVSSVIYTVADNYPPSQVLDVYLVALSNIPGWWVKMVSIQPLVETAVEELETRNPGLEFRTHWITELAYGRDIEYVPYVNEANDSRAAIPWVYFYPGRMPDPATDSDVGATHYYVAGRFKGRVNVDGVIINDYDGDATSPTYNPYPFALADQYNNALRYYDELELFNNRVAAGTEDEKVPTLRLLLDEMNENPAKFANALFVNLHGELLPAPPVRNYSDPAKNPENIPGIRVVTHPEQLMYKDTESVRLRVYAFISEPYRYYTSYSGTAYEPRAGNDMVREVKIYIPESYDTAGNMFTINSSDVTVYRIQGGIDSDGSDTVNHQPDFSDPDEAWSSGVAPNAGTSEEMYYTIQTNWDNPATSETERGCLITLFNTPLKCRWDPASQKGLYWEDSSNLYNNSVLYGLEYIPCPVVDNSATSRNYNNLILAGGSNKPKNTARWIIEINDIADSLPEQGYLTIETRLGDGNPTTDWQDLREGVLFPTRRRPANLSRTYTWIAMTPPVSERYQFIGDPRHHPYVDQAARYHLTLNPLGDGYNWFWDGEVRDPDDDSTVEYPSYLRYFDGWNSSSPMAVDVPRLFMIWRAGILGSRSIFTSMTGYSFYYLAIGNEIGYDADNDFPKSIPVSEEPFTGSAGDAWEQSILAGGGWTNGGCKWIKETDDLWVGLYWIGELYPDIMYTHTWINPTKNGNLPTTGGLRNFVREQRSDIDIYRFALTNHYPDEKITDFNPQRRTYESGCASFFNATESGGTNPFNHDYRTNSDATLTTDGEELSDSYNYPLPNVISCWRPFELDEGGNTPDEWSLQPYPNLRAENTLLNTFYLHSTGKRGSALFRMDDQNDTSRSCYFVVNGLSPSGDEGTSLIARYGMLSILQGFFLAGLSDTNRVVQLPRVSITKPVPADDLSSPASVQIEWTDEWKRWDGEKYTSGYSDTFSESETLIYVLMYSDDGGTSWKFVQDDSVNDDVGYLPTTTGGAVDTSHTVSSSPYTWSTPASKFPEGTYIIRLEVYRSNFNLHYSYHQVQVYIAR
jgi:type II secretory pathway pseudopilin PulG